MGNLKLNTILKTCSLFLLIFSLNVNPLLAQDTLRIQYSINASGTFKEGRLKQIRLPIRGSYTMSTSKWKMDFIANYKYQKTNGKLTENEFLSQLLISIFPKKNWFPIIGYSFFTSEFYQLKKRNKPGLGFGWKIFEAQNNSLYYYGWGAYDFTEFRNISGYQTFRFNSLLIGNHELIKNKLIFQYSFYFFQSLEERNNFIWRIEPRLLFELTKMFFMSINLESHFENIVDPTNTKRNSVLTMGIQFNKRNR